MKVTVMKPTQITVDAVRVKLPVNYEEEDIPNNFPLRKGDVWEAVIGIEDGKILGWPQGTDGILAMKVCDGGKYELLHTPFGQGGPTEVLATIDEDYVPHGVIPGEYGDYVTLNINKEGVITNWPRRPDVTAFFKSKED